jgi:hypothetical protein
MKANELRLGNWIEFNNFISPPNNLQVTPRMFRQLGMDLSENLDLELSGYHKPIPLTEEWLLRMGFEINKRPSKDIYIEFNPRMAILFNQGNVGEMDLIQDGKFISFKHGHIKYVHQLQNLYFALTNEELTMK